MLIPSKEKVASFDVDAQKTFTPLCPDELPVPEGDQIVDELNAQATKAVLRIGSKEGHSPQAIWVATKNKPVLTPLNLPYADVAWPVHAVPGTHGFELLDGLPHPAKYDYFVWKGVELDMHPYGSCFHDLHEKMSTGVIEFLHAHNIETVIVGGLATDYCVKHTVLQLCRAGFSVLLNLGACRGVDPKTSQEALDKMRRAGTIFINSAQDIINDEHA